MQKYKIYNKIKTPISFSEFPTVRLLKFKRSKWGKLKKRISRQKAFFRRKFSRQRAFFKKNKQKVYIPRKYYRNVAEYDKYIEVKFGKSARYKIFVGRPKTKVKKLLFRNTTFTLRKRFNFFEKVKQAYKNGLFLKYRIYQYFGSSMSLKYFKKQAILRKKVFHEFLIKSFFKLDILLWKLKFFYTIKQAQQYIKSKNVFVNNICITTSNFFLNKGDVIKILNTNACILKKIQVNTSFILSFCEVDFYTNRIILLKEFSSLTEGDFLLIFECLIGIRNFIYYLKKK